MRDIFPKWAIESGYLKKGLLYNYFKITEKNLYRSCNVIGIEAKSDLEYFENYGLNKSIKIEVLNNWGSVINPVDINSSQNVLDSKKVNIYSNIDEMLRMVDALTFHTEHGDVCPAGWQEGKTAMKASDEGMRQYMANEADNL